MTQQTNGTNLLVQGRLVWTSGNSLFEGKTKTDYDTGQVKLDQSGEPIKEYGFGLAIPKTDPQTQQNTEMFVKVWQTLHQEAMTLYPSGQLPPEFAMKFKDGDAVDHNGKPFADREGYKGHIVLACTTMIPIKYFRFEGGNNILVNDGIKCGDYVNVQLNVKAHPPKGRGKPGLYLNPSAVQLIQPGKEIINTPSGDQIFGQSAPAYQGQVQAPTQPQMPSQGQGAPQAPQMPQGAPQMPQQGQAPQQPQMPPQGQPQAPQGQPHYGVIPETHQPQQGQAPQQPQMPQGAPQMPQGAPQMPQQGQAPQGYPNMPQMPQ